MGNGVQYQILTFKRAFIEEGRLLENGHSLNPNKPPLSGRKNNQRRL